MDLLLTLYTYSLRMLIGPAVCHFFCSCDQYCVRRVSCYLTNSAFEALPECYGPRQLIIIGCGKPVIEVPYITETSAGFPVFTGPSGRTYEKIHITRTATRVTQLPSYTQVSLFRAMGICVRHMWRRASTGGMRERSCGKWMFRDRKHVYIRRVEHAEHLTAEKLLDILEYDGVTCDESLPKIQIMPAFPT